VVDFLRSRGHNVYDFRNPEANPGGFHWSDIDKEWESWNPFQYRKALEHKIAQRGFDADMHAMVAADVCVLVLPAGRSASFELGWMMGQGKQGIVLLPELEKVEPELMYRQAKMVVSLGELMGLLE
jgi:nucleoside 2-deoxyribosyltransferase